MVCLVGEYGSHAGEELVVFVKTARIVSDAASLCHKLFLCHPEILPDCLAVIACKLFYPAYAMAFSF